MKGYEILLRELRKTREGWKVKDLMTEDVKTISPTATMREAIRDMKRYSVHGLVVTEGTTPKGIVTTYDALLVMARGEKGERIPVSDVMSRNIVYTNPGEDVIKALEKMLDNQLTKLPVIQDGQLVGILSATDLVDSFDRGVFEHVPEENAPPKTVKLLVRDVMHEPTIVKSDETVCGAAKAMTEKGTGSVLIEKEGPCGIVTEKDIFKKVVAKGLDGTTIKVTEIMSSPCVTIEPDVSISEASRLFKENNIRRLPVVEKGEVIGVVSTDDIAKTLSMRGRL